MSKRVLAIVVSLLAVAVLAGACSGGEDPTATPRPTATQPSGTAPTATTAPTQPPSNGGAGTPVRVELSSQPYSFSPDGFDFTVGTTYSLTIVADAEFHTFSVSELWGDIFVNPNETVTQDITPDKAGTFKLFCVPHESTGMVGEVRVQ